MLAIVIPYYKISFFQETLDSLADQTDKNFKVYVGDDASPEDPSALLKNYKSIFNFEYKRFENNLGENSLVGQWERCINMTGEEEWIMLLGDDDVLEANVVSIFHKHLPVFEGKSKVVRFASKIINDKENNISRLYEQPQWEEPATAFYRRFKGHTRSTLSEYIFHRESYEKYGFKNFPLAWHSDDCAWLEFAEDKPIYGINDAVVQIRISELNITGKEDNLEEKWRAKRAFYEYIILHKLSYFNIEQRKFLLEAFENTIRKKRKPNFKEWGLLLKQYLFYTDIEIQKKFMKRKLKSTLSR